MTKAELIRKLAKNVGIPDQDAKIFFELLLKRISSASKIGQSVFIQDFGYFHLIKGSIKKPVFSFNDNEVSEEEVDLILFSEDSNLKKSSTKGLVFNIPFADDDDFHPIDAAFSLSIGKPLIPLRGVPFDDIYIPTSGYEYRRLIESKVEKIISAAAITDSVEDFPILVIDARSYNSNQVQLKWNEIADNQFSEERLVGGSDIQQTQLSEYEKQTQELKNIAWDFGEDLSQQIEVESILDIADEKINFDLNQKKNEIAVKESTEEIFTEEKSEALNEDNFSEVNSSESSVISEIELTDNQTDDDSSKKLDELLSFSENKEDVSDNISEDNKDIISGPEFVDSESITEEEIVIDDISEQTGEINEILTDNDDEQFWKSSSKYFETYKPVNVPEEDINEVAASSDHDTESENLSDFKEETEVEETADIDQTLAQENFDTEPENEEPADVEINQAEPEAVLEYASEQKPEFFEPANRKNYTPFIVFPLIVIVLSLALYWYLEYYQKKETPVKTKTISLNSANATIVKRSYDIPVSYPYPLKVNETSLSESTIEPEEIKKEDLTVTDQIEPKSEPVVEKKDEKLTTQSKLPETKKVTNTSLPKVNALNVGNNIFKYGDYYVVQVASFRANSISENEAGKYRNKGYNAFVEAAELPNRGTWYRVRVGNFSTKEEAQNFINKNIRP